MWVSRGSSRCAPPPAAEQGMTRRSWVGPTRREGDIGFMQELNEDSLDETPGERLEDQMQVRFDRDELETFYAKFEPFDITDFVFDQLEELD